jgi:hypothetical protein
MVRVEGRWEGGKGRKRKKNARIGSEDDADPALRGVPPLPQFSLDLTDTGRVRVDDLVVSLRSATEGDEVALTDLFRDAELARGLRMQGKDERT